MSRGRAVLTLGAVAVAVVVVVVLNVIGVLRYPGGSLREPDADGPLWLDTRPADAGTGKVGITSRAGVEAGTPIYTGIGINNNSPLPVTVERIRLVGAAPGLRLVDVRMALPDTSGGMAGAILGTSPDIAGLRLDADYGPLPANLASHNDSSE